MMRALSLARDYGIAVQIADLGDWGVDELRSEYDPAGPTILLNTRFLENLPLTETGRAIALAVGHELYHHRERLGDVERLREHAARERAADAFARKLLAET